VTAPIGEGFTSVNVGFERALDLYANLRPVANIAGVPARFDNVDMASSAKTPRPLCRLEHQILPGVVEKPEDHHGSGVDAHREVRVRACAAPRPQGRLGDFHKANIMR